MAKKRKKNPKEKVKSSIRIVPPASLHRVTFVLTGEMAGHIDFEAESARRQKDGRRLDANRSSIARRIIGAHYKIPEDRWDVPNPGQRPKAEAA